MRILFVFLLLAGTSYAQPSVAFVNDFVTYDDHDGFTISQEQKIDTFSGYVLDDEKAPCIAMQNIDSPHGNATSLMAELSISGANPGGSYVVIPIEPFDFQWLAGNENFTWFDTWSDGVVNSETFLDLIIEGVFDFGNNTAMDWSPTTNRYVSSGIRSTDFVILPLNPLLNNTFTNPELTIGWGYRGDYDSDYEITVNDINIVQVLIPANLTSPAADPYDWDRDGDVDAADAELCRIDGDVLPGDANGDGSVDVVDFNILAIWLFKTGTYWTRADFNHDGVTDGSDFNIWNDNRTDI